MMLAFAYPFEKYVHKINVTAYPFEREYIQELRCTRSVAGRGSITPYPPVGLPPELQLAKMDIKM